MLKAECFTYSFITDRIIEGGNAITSVRPSFRMFPLYLRNRLTVDLELLHVSRSWLCHSSQEIEGLDHRSRSRSWVWLMRSVGP